MENIVYYDIYRADVSFYLVTYPVIHK